MFRNNFLFGFLGASAKPRANATTFLKLKDEEEPKLINTLQSREDNSENQRSRETKLEVFNFFGVVVPEKRKISNASKEKKKKGISSENRKKDITKTYGKNESQKLALASRKINKQNMAKNKLQSTLAHSTLKEEKKELDQNKSQEKLRSLETNRNGDKRARIEGINFEDAADDQAMKFEFHPENKSLLYYGHFKVNDEGKFIHESRGILFEKDFTYVGEFNDGNISGKGVKIFPNLSYFVGEWNNGRKITGTLVEVDNRILQSGSYNEREELEGENCILCCSQEGGEIYFGGVKAGKRHGAGKQYYATSADEKLTKFDLENFSQPFYTGSIHLEGTWSNDQRDGPFKIFGPDGVSVRQKTFSDKTISTPSTGKKIKIISIDFSEEKPADLIDKVDKEISFKAICQKGYVLNQTELERIRDKGWLSSNNLNFYIDHITNEFRDRVWQENFLDPRIFVMDTTVAEYIQKKPKSMEYLENYTKRYTLPNLENQKDCLLIFDIFDRILVPIALHNHWTLAEINCQDKNCYKLHIYDSLSPTNPKNKAHHLEHLNIIHSFFEFEVWSKCKNSEVAKEYIKKLKKEWAIKSQCVTKQRNSWDCGVFVLGFIKYIFESRPINEFTEEKALEFRKEFYQISKAALERA